MVQSSHTIIAVIRQSPYGSTRARTALDIVLAAAAFEQPVSVLLCGEGVLQLIPNQNGDGLGVKTMSKQLASLPLYDIEHIYAEAEAIERYGIETVNAPLPVTSIAAKEIQQLLVEHDHVIGL
ncbi:MAG: sulfurtransferase complex subunit TusC [Halioglobus sp.]